MACSFQHPCAGNKRERDQFKPLKDGCWFEMQHTDVGQREERLEKQGCGKVKFRSQRSFQSINIAHAVYANSVILCRSSPRLGLLLDRKMLSRTHFRMLDQ
jgi:hypothetical protein